MIKAPSSLQDLRRRIYHKAKSERTHRFWGIFVHIAKINTLAEAYQQAKRNGGAPGLDGQTFADIETAGLDQFLADIRHDLLAGTYQSQANRVVEIPKDKGKVRKLQIPCIRDRVVQGALKLILEAIFEADFCPNSYGYRPQRSPHQAVAEVRRSLLRRMSTVIEVDVARYFDSLGHGLLQEFLQRRVQDGRIVRLIGKWLQAGVLDGETFYQSETGSPQGAVVSPLLGNLFLHQVVDEWYVCMVKPQLKGRSFLIRYGDDFVLGCELETDARRLMAVLPKRFARFGLTIHPQKTALVAFSKPSARVAERQGTGTFEFLGFTHYWARSRQGYWGMKRRTAKRRLRRTLTALWQWCRSHRHCPVAEQHQELCQKLRGHYQYYGVRGNYRLMEVVMRHAERARRYGLNRRGQQGPITGNKLAWWQTHFPLPTPRIVHTI